MHERALWEVLYTTGSTSDPVPLYNTTYDYHAYLHQSQIVADISGIGESDIIANLFPLTPGADGRLCPFGGECLCGRGDDLCRLARRGVWSV